MQTKHIKKNRLMTVIMLLIVPIAVFFIYFSDYYHTDITALNEIDSENISITDTDFGWLIDGPSNDRALIFYPGAKVEASAYEPFLSLVAQKGMDVLLVRMPFNFAVFGMNCAGDLMEQYSFDSWYIGGHSLGGAIAANYASSHPDLLDGLVLCASYPTKEIDDSLTEIVIYGSEDLVLNKDKVIEGREYAPQNYIEYIIEGGNHAQFGNYGIQRGDGTACITSDIQQSIAAQVIIENVG